MQCVFVSYALGNELSSCCALLCVHDVGVVPPNTHFARGPYRGNIGTHRISNFGAKKSCEKNHPNWTPLPLVYCEGTFTNTRTTDGLASQCSHPL